MLLKEPERQTIVDDYAFEFEKDTKFLVVKVLISVAVERYRRSISEKIDSQAHFHVFNVGGGLSDKRDDEAAEVINHV